MRNPTTQQASLRQTAGMFSLAVKQSGCRHQDMKINLAEKKSLSEQKDHIFKMLLTAGYQDLEELGAGAFGLVVKVKNQEGFKRALKIQLCGNAETDDEIEVGIP